MLASAARKAAAGHGHCDGQIVRHNKISGRRTIRPQMLSYAPLVLLCLPAPLGAALRPRGVTCEAKRKYIKNSDERCWGAAAGGFGGSPCRALRPSAAEQPWRPSSARAPPPPRRGYGWCRASWPQQHLRQRPRRQRGSFCSQRLSSLYVKGLGGEEEKSDNWSAIFVRAKFVPAFSGFCRFAGPKCRHSYASFPSAAIAMQASQVPP